MRRSDLLTRRTMLLGGGAAMAAAWLGCRSAAAADEVNVYCALDREFSEPLLTDFEQQLGLHVLAKYDVESTKTVGLANAIIAERNRPRCDLFWNNEILHTLRLKRLGLLQPYTLSETASLPASFRDPAGEWYGFAARARVLIVNTDLLAPQERPSSVDDLADPRWRGQAGIAKPLFGTTATHAAVMCDQRGEEETLAFFQAVQQNGKILGGNKQVARAVAAGELAFGLTDTDDAAVEIDAGRPVAIVYPDQAEGATGTLLIPNTLGLIRGGPNEANARRLAERIVSLETEERLAAGASAQIPLFAGAKERPAILPQPSPRWMEVDFESAAEQWDTLSRKLSELLQ
jgi:iron(III) transport system substrate-binding protein